MSFDALEQAIETQNKPFQILEGNFTYAIAIPTHMNQESIRKELERQFKDCMIDLARDENFGITGMHNQLGEIND